MQASTLRDVMNFQEETHPRSSRWRTPCIGGHQIPLEDFESEGELSEVCAAIVQKMHVFGKNWTTSCVLVFKRSGKGTHKVEQNW